ncbi:MAG TPA: aminoglycoside 6-adenylyltransferase [Rubrobacter sp.]|nr:aminoglycoside 6-adenylyltransferase [Rubrobacter sp.]
MFVEHDPSDVLRRLTRWAGQRDPIRAMLLTSTRANPSAPVDALSDYDVVLVVEDIHPLFTDRSWLEDFGEVLVAYWDPVYPEHDHGIEQTGNVTQYADGLKIDFRLWPIVLARRIAQSPVLLADLDVGYAVLLDKDGLFDEMRPPRYGAYVPARPDEETYLTHVNDFISDAPYVAKCLWRDELLPAKWCLEQDMKHTYLRPMLEWRMECDHGWSAPAGNLGKGLKKHLPPEIWRELEGTYAGAGIAENWEALFRTMALFRRVATDVGDDLGYAYPLDLDRRVTAYVRTIKDLNHGAD